MTTSRCLGRLFAATAASQLGTQISYVAIPLVAVTALHASPGQVGLLGMLGTAAFLLLGLPTGAWVDRARRRPVLVAADLCRAALLGSVPIAWWLGALTIEQLFAVVFLVGVGTVFADVAAQSYLPHLAGRDGLVAANSRLVAISATNTVAGRSAGGLLVQALSAPVAIAVDVLSYLVSAVLIGRIARPEPRPERTANRRLGREIRAGVAFLAGHRMLLAVATAGAASNLFIHIGLTMVPVLFERELGVGAGILGLYLATGGVGMALGSLAARRLADRLGEGRTLWLVGAVTAPVGLLVPLVDRGPMLWVAAAAWLVSTFKVGVDNVIAVSFRQRATPDELLGRVNATMRFLLTGAIAIGTGLAGLLGEFVGVRAAMWIGAVGLSLCWLPIYLSPIRTTRTLPSHQHCPL